MISRRDFLDRLDIRLPIVQAPMAGVSSPAMAAAVGAAGALGSLGLGASDAAAAARMIVETRQRYDGPLNVNFFCHEPAIANAERERAWIERFGPQFEEFGATALHDLREIYRSFAVDRDMLAMLLALRPSVVSFHFGVPPADGIAALRDAGLVLVGSATSLAEARRLEAAGFDAVVAQGWEAGGHRGCFDPDAPDDRIGTATLTRILTREIGLPVIAAGGIMDGAGIAAALTLGAVAAQLGTAFVACDESLADEGYRRTLASEAAHHTVMTRAISGRPARSLANRFTELARDLPDADVPAYPIAYDLGKTLHAAGKSRGEYGFGAHWAGQGAPLARSMPAARLVELLERELDMARGCGRSVET